MLWAAGVTLWRWTPLQLQNCHPEVSLLMNSLSWKLPSSQWGVHWWPGEDGCLVVTSREKMPSRRNDLMWRVAVVQKKVCSVGHQTKTFCFLHCGMFFFGHHSEAENSVSFVASDNNWQSLFLVVSATEKVLFLASARNRLFLAVSVWKNSPPPLGTHVGVLWKTHTLLPWEKGNCSQTNLIGMAWFLSVLLRKIEGKKCVLFSFVVHSLTQRPHCSHPTILEMLNISDVIVANCLIDQVKRQRTRLSVGICQKQVCAVSLCLLFRLNTEHRFHKRVQCFFGFFFQRGIESVLLIQDKKEARNIMSSTPTLKNTREVRSLFSLSWTNMLVVSAKGIVFGWQKFFFFFFFFFFFCKSSKCTGLRRSWETMVSVWFLFLVRRSKATASSVLCFAKAVWMKCCRSSSLSALACEVGFLFDVG